MEEALAGLKISPAEGSKFSKNTAGENAQQHNGNIYGNVTYYNTSAEPSKAPEEKKGNKHWMVRRHPNALFVGQQSVLADLEECLLPTSDRDEYGCPQYVLQGIGGVGKSEIALQFAYRHRQAFWGVFWIDLGSTEAARLGFTQIANKCGWSIDSGENSTIDMVDHLSNSTEPWLLLLDNCDDPEQDYSAYFPSSPQGAVIMTTRLDLASEYGTAGSHKLDGLDLNSSIDLLAKAVGLPRPLTQGQNSAAADIAERVGYHALAITVAGSVIKAGLHGLEEYAQVLVQKEAELLKTKPKQAQSTYGTVHATFEVSAQRLQECGEDSAKNALELLGILAFLDRTNVTEALFVRAWEYGSACRNDPGHVEDCTHMTDHTDCNIYMLSPWHFNTVLDFSWASSTDMSLFRKARSRLHELSLITWTPEDNTISMHPLLHSWARNRLNDAERVSAWHTAATTLVLSTEGDARWRDFTYHLQRQIEVCFDLRIKGSVHFVCPLDLCRNLNFFWWQLERVQSRFTADVVDQIEQTLPAFVGKESDTYLQVSRMRAIVLDEAGDLPAAISVYRDVVSARQRTADPESHGLRLAQNGLAERLIRAGEYQECIDILEGVKRVEDGMMDIKPSDRCATLSRLARAYLGIDRPQESLELLKEVIAIREQFMEAEDPELLASRHGLGRAYLKCGQAAKAVGILEDVVRIRERILAPENKERLTSQNVLGKAYVANGQSEKAVIVLEEAVRIQEYTLLPEHKHRLSSQHELGRAYLANGQNEKAVAVFEEVVRIQERTLVPEHAELLASQHELARAYRANGQISKAVPILEHVVNIKQRIRSPSHRKRYVSEELLLLCYIDYSQDQNARQLLDQMKVTSHLLSEKHQKGLQQREKKLLDLEHRVAREHYDQGRLDEAIELMERVVHRSSELFPAESEPRHNSEYNLVSYYIEASRTFETRRLLDRVKETAHLLSEEDQQDLEDLEKGVEELEARERLSTDDDEETQVNDGEELLKDDHTDSL